MLSPLPFTLFTHDCIPSQSNISIIKFTDGTTIIGLITGREEAAYREEVAQLVSWCQENSLSLNAENTKEMIIDPRRRRDQHAPLYINGIQVEKVKTFKLLGTHISEDFT